MTAGAISQAVTPDRVQAPLDRAVLPSADVAAIQTLLAAGKLDGPDGALALLRQRGAAAGLDQRHVDTLKAIATDRRYGTPDRAMAAARMYLQLLGAGCFAFLAETERGAGQRAPDPAAIDRSRAAMDDLLRSSIAVWRGDDVRPEMKNGRDRPQRLAEFVTQLNRAMERPGEQGRFANALRSARSTMLTPTGEQRFAQPTRSEYDGLSFPPAQPALVAQPGARGPAGAPITRPLGPNPRAMTLPQAAQARPLERRGPRAAGEGPEPLAAPAVAPAQTAPPRQIRGTDIQWSADAVARYINENSNDTKRLDALGGLRLQDRIAVAEAYARLRGQPHVQGQALAYLIEQMSGGRSGINGQLFRDMLRPSNSDGITSEHILINIDATGGSWLSSLTGIGGANHEAIERVLMFRSRTELAQIDAAMRLPPEQGGYGRSLRDTLKLVDDGRARARLLFLYDVPRRDTLGEIPQAELQAWHVRAALNNFSTFSSLRNNIRAFSTPEWGNIFASITAMSPREVQAVAKAYYEQVARDGQTPQEGGDGSSGNLADSALGRTLLRESAAPIRLAGGEQEHGMRMRLALQGLRFEAGNFAPPQLPGETPQAYEQRAYPIIAQAEAQHRERVAQYIAVTIELARRGQIATDEIQGALALIKRPPPAGQLAALDGRPFPQQVIAQYAEVHRGLTGEQFSSFDEQVIKMVQHANYSVAGTAAQQNTWNLIAGEGRDSGGSRAMLLVAALSGPLGMLGGPYRQRTYQLLDLRGVPESQRETMRAQMRQQYAMLQPGHSLDADIQSAFGPNITLPSGNVIPSQAMRLAQRGVISNAERIIYALYEPGMFGLARAENIAAVSRILGELTPLEKVATRMEFQRLTGRDLRAELDNYPGREARMAAMATRVFPHERDLLGAQAMLYLNAATNDQALAAQRAAVTGRSPEDITDFLSRNFADQAGLTAMRQFVDQSGGAAQFSLVAIDSAADLQNSVRAATDAAIGNALTRFIQSGFSNAEEGLGVRRRTLEEYAERAQRELAATGSISPETQAEMGFLVRDVRERLRARGADVDRGTELVSNIAVTAALVTTMALAPQTGALWMSVIGGGTGLATRMALGQVDTVSQGVGIFLRDAAKGLAFQQSAALMATVPAEAGIVENAMVGMAAGYNTGLITSASQFITDPELWRLDPGQALDNFMVNYSNATSGGMIAGGISAALVRAIRGNAKPPQQDQGPGPGPGPDPGPNGGPSRGQPPIDRPVTGPGRPGGPGRPVDPQPPTVPGRPTGPGPGNIGTPTGPMPGRPTGPTTIGGQNVGGPTGPVIGRPTGTTGTGGQNVGGTNGPVIGRPSGQITTTTTGASGTGTARPPVTQPSRDIPPGVGANGGTPVAPNSGTPVAGNTGTSVVIGRPTGTAGTGLGTGVVSRPGGATRSLAIPGATRSAVVATDNTSWTMNVATIGWSAIAVAASTNGGLDYFNASASEDLRRRVEELRRRVDGEARIPTNEMRRALETMSEPERREQVLAAGSAFAFSALAYMEQHNGRLPGSDRDPSDFNTLLDMAWTNAGLAAGRSTDRVSRAEKVRQLVAFHLGVPQPTGPAREPGQEPRPPGPAPQPEEPRGPRGPGRGPLASPQFYDQLIAGTGTRLRNVNRGWIDRNLQNAIRFRTGVDAPQFPQGNAQDWINLVNRLPDRPLPELIRDDAEGLRVFGFRMPQNRQGERERPIDVTQELIAARDRARVMAPLGEPADRNPVSVPQFFEALPSLRQFMVAATGKDEPQISAMRPEALVGAIVGYKDRLRANPQSAALMQGISQDPVIERRTLEAHQRAAGVSGPNAIPDDPVEFGRRWEAVMQRLSQVDADAQKDRDNVAAASAEAARAIERGRERGLINEQQRAAMTAAFAQAVLANSQGEARMNRLRAFIMGTQDSPQVASDVFAVLRQGLTPAELRTLAIGLAGNVREPNTAAPPGTLEVDMAKMPLGIVSTLDRLPGLERDREYQEAARRLRQVTIMRRLQENRLNDLFANDLELLVREGHPQLIAAVLARSGEVTSGEELVVRQLINAANTGRADRAGVVLHSLYAAGEQDPRFAALAVSLACKLWNEQTIAQVNWSRRDDIAVAVGWDQLNGPRQKSDPSHPLISLLAQSEQGRAALRAMVSSIEWDARHEGRWSWEWILTDRIKQLLRTPVAPPPAQPQG